MQNEHQALAKIRRIASHWLADHEEDATAAMQKIAAVLVGPLGISDAELIERLQADNQRLRQRLESDPRFPYDGIDCRDATIKLLEGELNRWKASDEKSGAHIQYLQAEMVELRTEVERLQIVTEDTQATAAARDVLVERRRQITAEGWTPEHDDKHENGDMARAAACYALAAAGYPVDDSAILRFWPWLDSWWRPGDQRRSLVKAGALILAEIERLDRGETAKPAQLYSEADESRMDVIGQNGNEGEHYELVSPPATDAQACEEAFQNEHHKIPAAISRIEWDRLWKLGQTPPQLRAAGWIEWDCDSGAARPTDATHVLLRRGIELESDGINWGSMSDSFRGNEVIAYRVEPVAPSLDQVLVAAAPEELAAALEPSADGWIEWLGGRCPVAAEDTIELRIRAGTKFTASSVSWPASKYNWGHTGNNAPWEIVAYRPVPASPRRDATQS